jgi:hypothetical protein
LGAPVERFDGGTCSSDGKVVAHCGGPKKMVGVVGAGHR